MSSLSAMMPQMQQPQALGGGALAQYIQTLPPAQQAQWLQANTALQQGAGQQKSATDALAQSEAMRKQLAGQTPYGLGGGIGQGLASVITGIDTHMQRNKQQAALDKTSGANDRVLELLLKQLQGPQVGQPSIQAPASSGAAAGAFDW